MGAGCAFSFALGIGLMLAGVISGRGGLVFLGIIIMAASFIRKRKTADDSLFSGYISRSTLPSYAPPRLPEGACEVKLVDPGAKKIQVIKVIRSAIPFLGLAQAKELVDSAPSALAIGVARDWAESLRFALVREGATVMITEQFVQPGSAPVQPQAPLPDPIAMQAALLNPGGPCQVTLTSAGYRKIEVIKTLREQLTYLTLKEAKDLVDGAPSVIASGVTRDWAERVKFALERDGASVAIAEPAQSAQPPVHAPEPAAATPAPAPPPPISEPTPAPEAPEPVAEQAAVPPQPIPQSPPPYQPQAVPVDGSGSFQAVLLSAGSHKIMLISVLESLLGIGVIEATKLADSTPSVLKSGISGIEADRIREALQPVGATVGVVQVQAAGAAGSGVVDLVITSAGDKKIPVRQALKKLIGLDLVQAYEAVESSPRVLKSAIPRAEAERLKAALEAEGAKVEVRPSAG